MSDKEKLMMLIDEMPPHEGKTFEEALADRLIANSVTIQKHGRWEEYQIPRIMCCSECDWGTDTQSDFKYCPNCGALMDGESDVQNN